MGMGLGFLLLVTYTDYLTVISQQQLKYQSVVKRWSMEVTYLTFWQLLYQYADVIWNNRQAIDVTRLLPAFSNGN